MWVETSTRHHEHKWAQAWDVCQCARQPLSWKTNRKYTHTRRCCCRQATSSVYDYVLVVGLALHDNILVWIASCSVQTHAFHHHCRLILATIHLVRLLYCSNEYHEVFSYTDTRSIPSPGGTTGTRTHSHTLGELLLRANESSKHVMSFDWTCCGYGCDAPLKQLST